MGFLDFLNPGKGYKAGQNQLNRFYGENQNLYNQGLNQAYRYYNQGQDYLNPYNQQGQNAYGPLATSMDELLHPERLQNQWTQGYHESDYAKQLENMAQERGLSSASSQGLLGSTPALHAIQQGTTNIANADRQQYLADLMDKYMKGAELARGIYTGGLGAAGQQGSLAGNMGSNLLQAAMNQGTNAMNMGGNSAQMAYGQQNAPGNLFNSIIGQGIGLFGSALAGPMGGALAKRWNLSGG
ncbi:hypothetical protein [Pedobacter sp.]|jgi:hypothetical protein|uniref:hypothetical protein n=1 Tax=Pedobacter sp. TaxID=1411316 RepID=UPI002BC29159|nr:hypothetical protein [Pedobacter sp.]HWW39675.1 hypothetical protein [Pedobacter sp.]